MSLPQPGIFVEGSRRHMFMEYQFNAGADSVLARAALGRAMGALQPLATRWEGRLGGSALCSPYQFAPTACVRPESQAL